LYLAVKNKQDNLLSRAVHSEVKKCMFNTSCKYWNISNTWIYQARVLFSDKYDSDNVHCR